MKNLEIARTDLPVVEDDLVPTREEHRRFIRRLWKTCIVLATVLFVVAGVVVAGLFFAGHAPDRVVEISTAIFQVIVLSYGMGFFVPAFLTSLVKMSMGVEMSRKGLEIGKTTAAILRDFQREIKPLLADAGEVVGSVRKLVEDLKHQDVGKIVEFLERVKSDGTVDRVAASLEVIAKKFDSVIKSVKDEVISKEIDNL